MATLSAEPTVDISSAAPDYLAHERRLQAYLRTLSKRGWQERLTPLAQHMAAHHLVRAHSYAGAFQRHLEVGVLREALSNLLRQGEEDGYLIVDVLIEAMEPATAAAERGVSEALLVDMLRDAVEVLATAYEDVANAFLD
jgi:hypothetical protein